MKLKQLVDKAKDKNNFKDLNGYIGFCNEYLAYITDNLQATIVSQNENHYTNKKIKNGAMGKCQGCLYGYRKSKHSREANIVGG